MEQNRELLEVMNAMQREQARQTVFCRLQMILTAVCAVSCLALTLVLGIAFYRLNASVDAVRTSVSETTGHINAVIAEISEIDFAALEESVTSFSDNGASAISELQNGMSGLESVLSEAENAIANLNAIDIDALNDGIERLNSILKPVADFFSWKK